MVNITKRVEPARRAIMPVSKKYSTVKSVRADLREQAAKDTEHPLKDIMIKRESVAFAVAKQKLAGGLKQQLKTADYLKDAGDIKNVAGLTSKYSIVRAINRTADGHSSINANPYAGTNKGAKGWALTAAKKKKEERLEKSKNRIRRGQVEEDDAHGASVHASGAAGARKNPYHPPNRANASGWSRVRKVGAREDVNEVGKQDEIGATPMKSSDSLSSEGFIQPD